MHQLADSRKVAIDTEIQVERVKAALSYIPLATLVTVVNATVMVGFLSATGEAQGVFVWLALSVLVAGARLGIWWAHHRSPLTVTQYRRWSFASVSGAFAAGALWGAGSVLLATGSEIYQLLWAFLIAGMCAGASALHYAHPPTSLAFVLPASIPLAIRFAVDGSGHRGAAGIMIAVFIVALVITVRSSSHYFGESVRLRLDLVQGLRELDAAKAKLQTEAEERRKAEESLRQAQKMEAVGQLTGGIAHDFNNLLTVVLSNLDLLAKHLPPGDSNAMRLLNGAVHGAERGAALTQRLLIFGRRQTLTPEIVDLSVLVPGLAALLRSSLGTGRRVVMRFPEQLGPVRVDANQLELALLNLVVNARDAMPQGGVVTISAREVTSRPATEDGLCQGAYVVLSVTDTGEGMDEATLARAVEPFFTTKGVGKGTGLGLAMVHGFAAQSGGRFVLESQPGVGTTAELWLPRANVSSGALPPSDPPKDQLTSPYAFGRYTILVVDDDPLVLASTTSMLEDLGHTVRKAESGEMALELLRAGLDVDVVVTDYLMPGMSGLQLAHELGRLQPRLPILLATGYTELQANAVAGIARLSKPFRQDTLAKAIAGCLRTAASQ
jgi:signal transduction histidine kinase